MLPYARALRRAAIGCLLCLLSAAASASDSRGILCNSYNPLEVMFTDVCWSSMFPIRIAGVDMIRIDGANDPPSSSARSPLCVCGGDLSKGEMPKIGFTIGMWMPSRIIDVTRRPNCFASLRGIEIPMDGLSFLTGGQNLGRGDHGLGFFNWVMYAAPLVYMLRIIDEGACPADGVMDFDILQTSSIFPTHNDVLGQYTTLLNPESLLLSSVSSLLALPVDAVAASSNSTLDHLFWTAGSWGLIYPLTGFVSDLDNVIRGSSLTAARATTIMHRLGMLRSTVGMDNICRRKTEYMFKKSHYRWQILAPSPEVKGRPIPSSTGGSETGTVREVVPPSRFGKCTHVTGAPTAQWGMWRDVPATGEDHSYMLFQWTDCCFGITP